MILKIKSSYLKTETCYYRKYHGYCPDNYHSILDASRSDNVEVLYTIDDVNEPKRKENKINNNKLTLTARVQKRTNKRFSIFPLYLSGSVASLLVFNNRRFYGLNS